MDYKFHEAWEEEFEEPLEEERPEGWEEPEEVWRQIRTYPHAETSMTRYSVSSLGRVRNDRTDRIMTQAFSRGALTVTLQYPGECRKRCVGHLVVEEFLAKRPVKVTKLYYKDGNRENCSVNNLSFRAYRVE